MGWEDGRGDREISVTDTVVRRPLFSRPGGVLKLTLSWGALQRPSSLAPSHPGEPSGPPPVLHAEVMLPPPIRTRSLDIRQALHWLILACGPPPAHGDISYSLLPQMLQRWASPNAATTNLHSLVPRAARHPASVFWIPWVGVRHLLPRTPVKLPNGSHQKPSCEARRWYSYPSPKEERGLCGGLTAALSKKSLLRSFSRLTVGERHKSGFLSPFGRFPPVDCFITHFDTWYG